MRRLTVPLFALTMVISACGAGPISRATTEPSEPTQTNDGQTLIGCPGGPWFPRSALDSQIDLASSGRDEIVEAITPFLEGEEGQFWPQEDWKILHAGDDAVILVHLEPPDSLSFMTVTRTAGSWNWSGAQTGGPCPLVVQMAEGLNTVEWRVDPDESPSPDSVSIRLVLNERECVSGQEIGDRLVGPEIVYTEGQVLVSFAAEPPPGDAFNCQGNPETPFALELDEPLGDRELIDARDTGINLEDVLG